MNKFKFYFIVLIATITLFSCEKEDNTIPTVPLRNYKEQYDDEIKIINNYLGSHYISVINNPGKSNDQDITISKITDAATQFPISSYKNNTGDTYPQLRSRIVDLHGFDYEVHYLILRQGSENPDPNIDIGGESPCNTDSVLTSYSGSYLKETTTTTTTTEGSTVSATFFEESKFPSQFFSLLGVIRGWSEIFPQFKTGWYKRNVINGTISFYDFGAGVMFIPSGLAYYNSSSVSIPSYSPLVFSFKLYEIDRVDTDGDGVVNYQEDISDGGEGVGYMYSYANKTNYPNYPVDAIRYSDDTDRDGIPNFLDIDDDGDNYSTKVELKKPDGTYHTFETVLSCSGQTVKRHLTASCKPPYTD